ncbi:MAG: hypothetical protein KGD59_05880 [Candidatus Heimdallarchaeota archaeon]|nr:hypothetical protein [Candidatus Heimdallarchaeota archaeon]MBY8994061.1 hypothetical protein [Candidatus Heimdallarchaeota archaeon]
MSSEKSKNKKEEGSTSKKKQVEEQEEVEYIVEGKILKQVTKAKINFSEEFDKKIRNLQIIALVMVFVISLISPLRLIESRTYFDFTAVGFVTASFIPSLIAIFGFMRGGRISLYVSLVIYGLWILVLSSFYWEVILLMSVLVIYFEVTRMIQLTRPLLQNIKSISRGGAYYHVGVFLERYFRFLLKFCGFLVGFSITFGVLGWYIFEPLPSDILFSIFFILCLAMIIMISRRTITKDIQKILIEEERDRMEYELAISHSRYS